MNRRKKYSIEEVKNFAIKEKNGLCLSEKYENNKANLIWKCGNCGHIFYNSFKNVKYLNNWCPSCSGKLNNNINIAKNIAKERNGFCLSETYKNNKTKLIWKCKKCYNIWEARLDRIKAGTWCPNCKKSHGETKISNILDSLKIKYNQEYIFNDLRNRRYDFYLIDYNILIEFDGVQHFQIYGKYTPDNETLIKKQKYDIEKTLFCIKNNIKLLRICYKNIKDIEYYIKLSLNCKEKIIFSDWKSYDFIIEKIGYITFLTGVGE
jgi:DNA-directed RNA polymerase subunit RPC12/RpoP/very-short-patch-repair endonuclease